MKPTKLKCVLNTPATGPVFVIAQALQGEKVQVEVVQTTENKLYKKGDIMLVRECDLFRTVIPHGMGFIYSGKPRFAYLPEVTPC